jgi:hypothetical protein
MTLYDLTVPQVSKMLRNLDRWMHSAAKHAEAKKFDVNTLVHARLAPDQFAFARQVQTSCDNARFIVCRLTGKDIPSVADTETTFEQLHARIASTLAYLETYKPADFAGAEERKVTLRFLEGKWITGVEYLCQFALPNFYFHVTTAYAILRHNGVDVGKFDYIGDLPAKA